MKYSPDISLQLSTTLLCSAAVVEARAVRLGSIRKTFEAEWQGVITIESMLTLNEIRVSI
jgi:hypothetical protein